MPRTLICLLLILTLACGLLAQDFPDSVNYEILDEALSEKAHFDNLQQKEIDGLIQAFRSGTGDRKFQLLAKLQRTYLTFDYDSAISYANSIKQIAEDEKRERWLAYSELLLANTYLSSGVFIEAKEVLASILSQQLADSTKADYYYSWSRLYFDLSADYSQPDLSKRYNRLGLQYLDSALIYARRDEPIVLSLQGLKFLKQEDFPSAATAYARLFREFTLDDRQFAIDASTYAYVLKRLGFDKQETDWLIRAAMADIRSANKENTALRTLANKLLNEGNLERSARYLKTALEDAEAYGARQRKFQISQLQPLIEKARIEAIEEERLKAQRYSRLVTGLSLMIIVILVLLYLQLKKVRAARNQVQESNRSLSEINAKLREVNMIKEEYMGHFFKTSSDLITSLDQYRQKVENRFARKKFEDLDKVLERKDIKEEREKLFETFDTSFLKIFPQFVLRFNSLFPEADKYNFERPNELNTDLRIFALIRLGIKDTERIANILDYSVHTINTYKTRVKNASIVANEDFEHEIMKIESV